MSSIITVTFNPALDKSISVPELMPDKKLMCSQPVVEPGGGGINVARAIKKLGGDATAVYLSGGDPGRKIGQLLTEEHIESIAVNLRESTRENLIVADLMHDRQYLFDMPGPHVIEHEWEACLAAIEAVPNISYLVVSGSLPSGVPASIFSQIARVANKKSAKLIVDTSGEALKVAVNAGVYLIKLNVRELASLVDEDDLNIEKVADVAKQVIDKADCEAAVISMGPFGAMLVTKEFAMSIQPPKLHTESTVGAGDSLVAGIILSLSEGKTLIEAVQYGVACGSAATIHPGTELCLKSDVERIFDMIKSRTPYPEMKLA